MAGLIPWSEVSRTPGVSTRLLFRIEQANRLFATSAHVVPAFDGQDVSTLGTILGPGFAPPNLDLTLLTLHDGYFWICPGQDGILFTREGAPIAHSLRFRDRTSLPDQTALSRQAIKLDFDAFIAVDVGWTNYAHWLCLAIPKMLLARGLDLSAFRLVAPHYRRRGERGRRMGYSETVWTQSIAAFGLGDVIRLAPGLYTCARISTITVNHAQPSFFMCFAGFLAAYERVRNTLRVDATAPKRILIRRRDNVRMNADEFELVETAAGAWGFTTIELEGLDLKAQADLFFNAQAVMAAHGAGLTNIVFGGRGLRVLEIQRRFPPANHLRPWLSVIARGKGQAYSFLDADAGELTRDNVESAIRNLCRPHPLR